MDPKKKEREQKYQKMVQTHAPKPPIWRHVLLAFLVGGAICLVGQIVLDVFIGFERTQLESAATTLAAMIFVGALLTGFGVYDEIAEIGGAGAAVPITGFANTIVAAAMDFRREGPILGMGAKMFVIAGPVLVYGILSAFIVSLIKSAVLGYF